MPVILMNVPSKIGEDKESIIKNAVKMYGIRSGEIIEAEIYKSSLDARKQDNIHFVNSIILSLKSSDMEKKLSDRNKGIKYFEEPKLMPKISSQKRDGSVVIAGFGPAGMFCALLLSEYGYKPVVLERGADIENRVKAVEGFWAGGELDPVTNVQFGEGGAGTFSDGKLTTRIGDPLVRYVLHRFVDFGAPKEILSTAKPHIGTDKLREIVKAIRQRIIQNGGEVRFLTALEDINIKDGKVSAVRAGKDEIPVSAAVIAIGHSARDTFKLLLDSGAAIEPKPFSVGARIEHTQISVDESLYGHYAGADGLPKGEYQLSHRRVDGRACYTFCMCPGGSVVAAVSEKESVVTNGMSEYARDGVNANAALVVSVTPDDFGKNPLDGVEFARSIEKKAYKLSGSYCAPASTVGAFLCENGQRSVISSYKPGIVDVDLNKLFPKFVCDMMKEGIGRFAKEMKCFKDKGALLTAPETRTSSPVRILRTEQYNALGIDNLYPCGEGAGYAGGIVSAAVDGLRTAIKIMESFAP